MKGNNQTIHIDERRGGKDVLFRDLRLFQANILLDITCDIKNQEVRNLRMELLKKDSKYSLNGTAKALIRRSLNDVLPHEINSDLQKSELIEIHGLGTFTFKMFDDNNVCILRDQNGKIFETNLTAWQWSKVDLETV
jgi:hypothetical protein